MTSDEQTSDGFADGVEDIVQTVRAKPPEREVVTSMGLNLVLDDTTRLFERNVYGDGRIKAKAPGERGLGDLVDRYARVAVLDAWNPDDEEPEPAPEITEGELTIVSIADPGQLVENRVGSDARYSVGTKYAGKRVRVAVIDTWASDEPMPPFYAYVDGPRNQHVKDTDVGQNITHGPDSPYRGIALRNQYDDTPILGALVDTWGAGEEVENRTVRSVPDREGFIVAIPSVKNLITKRANESGHVYLGRLGNVGTRFVVLDTLSEQEFSDDGKSSLSEAVGVSGD